MEVNIKYSDFNNEIEKVMLEIDTFQKIELQNVVEKVGYEEDKKYLELRYVDNGNGSVIYQRLDKEDLYKYMNLLKLLGRQL